MKIKTFTLLVLIIGLSFNSCNKEESILIYQEKLLPEIEQNEIDLDIHADLEESVQAIIRSLDLSMKGLPANINEISFTPTGAMNPNGEARLVIATGTFTASLLIKAQDLATGTDLATSTITGNGMMGYTTLSIPAYEASSSYPPRVVGLFYFGNTNQWELFHFETQAPNGKITNPGPTHPGGNWYGCGVYAALESVTGTFYEVTTACRNYSERSDKSDKGNWYVPNRVQMEAIAEAKVRGHSGLQNLEILHTFEWPYWTTEIYRQSGKADMLWIVSFPKPGIWQCNYLSLPTTKYIHARCVTSIKP